MTNAHNSDFEPTLRTDEEAAIEAEESAAQLKAVADRDEAITDALERLFAGEINLEAFEATPGLFEHGWMGDVVRAVMQLEAARAEGDTSHVTIEQLIAHLKKQNHTSVAATLVDFLSA